jgi:hypothetical protein
VRHAADRRRRAKADGGEAAESTTPTALDLRVLVISAAADEPSLLAWRQLLDEEGVPYDLLVAGQEPLTSARLTVTPAHGRYQAVVLATDSLLHLQGGEYVSALAIEEWFALRNYQRTFGVRQVSAYATPTPRVGLNSPSWAGDASGIVGHVTPEGHELFPELVGPVPISPGTYGFAASPVDEEVFTSLVVNDDGLPLVGIVEHPGGREELVLTVSCGPHSRHLQLLGHGMLGWVTRGRYLGRRRFYLSVQVDDVLLGAIGRPKADGTPGPLVRMTADDVKHAAKWSAENQFMLEFAFNGWGAVSATNQGEIDPLTQTLLDYGAQFIWINHTFGHLNLDNASSEEIGLEITKNLAWAAEQGLVVEPDALVTGAHSGLNNPNLGLVLAACGVNWIASDASVTPDQSLLGRAYTVPRHPISIPLNVTTREELIASSPSGMVIDWSNAHSGEGAIMLAHVLSNDPRPHYTHQNTLTGERLLLELFDNVLASYRSLINAPLLQPTLAEAGVELWRRLRWQAAIAAGTVVATQFGDDVLIDNLGPETIEVPLTGFGEQYEAERAGWAAVAAGSRMRLPE